MDVALVIVAVVFGVLEWLKSHAIELLWMLTVLGTASVLVSGLETVIKLALTEGARLREEQAQHQAQRHQEQALQLGWLRQEHWRIRHRHSRSQCEVCKEEAQRGQRGDEDGLGIFRR